MAQKIVWLDGDNIFVVRKGSTSNKKITDGSHLVQTYTFSVDQWKLATTSKGFGMKKFFELDGANCRDCPFSGNSGNGGCYTHKFNQYVGFLSMLRSIDKTDLTPLTVAKQSECQEMARNTYVRFGTYGEPSLLPIKLVRKMAAVASSYTGYTHQWNNDWAKEYAKYFMASTHGKLSTKLAKSKGFRSFIAIDGQNEVDAVQCPASKEAGFKSNCASCGLCSGMLGKGNKDVKINIH